MPEHGEQPQTAAEAGLLDILLPDAITKILMLLAEAPESIVAFSITSTLAHEICTGVWAPLCSKVTDTFPGQLKDVPWSPEAWRLTSHKDLYLSLLLPFKPLLQQRVWHSMKMPAGQLLVIDAQPPCLLARSVFYRDLEGPPFGRLVFVVRLPDKGKGKARAYCCSCRPRASPMEVGAANGLLAAGLNNNHNHSHNNNSSSSSNSAEAAAVDSTLRPAHLEYLPLSEWPGGRGMAGSSSGSGSGGAGGDDDPNSIVAGFFLNCTSSCGNLYAEEIARKHSSQPYSSTRAAAPAAAAAAARPHTDTHTQQQQQQQQPASGQTQGSAGAPSNGNAAAETAVAADQGNGGNSSSGSSSALLPLPAVDEPNLPHWYLTYFVHDLDIPPQWRSQAMYWRFPASVWLQPPAAAAAAATASTSSAAAATDPAAASSSGSSSGRGYNSSGFAAALERPLSLMRVSNQAPSSISNSTISTSINCHPAASLTGLWRGTYGAHGVELLHVQLLPMPSEFNLHAYHNTPEQPPQNFSQCPEGVLLQSVVHRPPPERPPGTAGASGGSSNSQPAQQQQPPAGGAAAIAAAVDSTAAAAEADGGSEQGQQQPQRLLLVATKVLGDRNVHAGQVSFVVDLDSRSTLGAGQVLELPAGVHSDVKLNSSGTRPLLIKECYSGLAQIAEAYFHSPKILAMDLIVFEGNDCLGMLWKAPMDSFSLFSRVHELP